MPYIPPPRPPPAPRPPPVFRPPPGPNIHHQQQMRIQQQQQQQMRHQQQVRQFHQTQQQFLANQHRMQLDRNRQQQMQLQQQLQRQQQDNHRRQQQLQQDHLRRQQQFHQDQLRRQQQLTQQEQQRRQQQQLLRGLQTNTDSSGSSVYISPAFTLEINGLNFSVEGQGPVGATPNGVPQSPQQQATPTPPPSNTQEYPPPYSPSPPAPVFPSPQAPPPAPPAQMADPLPPKLDPSFPPLQQNGTPPSSPPQFVPQPTPPQNVPQQPKRNQILLKDGTIITFRGKDDYLFVGPKGQQMVVNCLPLFTSRPETQSSSTGRDSETEKSTEDVHSLIHEPRKQERRQTKAMRRFVLKKASSTDNLLSPLRAVSKTKPDSNKRSSEAEDILNATTRSSIKVQRSVWTQFTSSHPVLGGFEREVESQSAPSIVVAEPRGVEQKEEEEEEGKMVRRESTEEVDGGEIEEEKKEKEEEVKEESKDEPDSGERDKETEKEGSGGGGGMGGSFSDGGSDGEESKEMRVSYIDNPEQIQTLKRSGGSVSFIGKVTAISRLSTSPPPPSVPEDESEEKEEGGDMESNDERPNAAGDEESEGKIGAEGSDGIDGVEENEDKMEDTNSESTKKEEELEDDVKPNIEPAIVEAASKEQVELERTPEVIASLASTAPLLAQAPLAAQNPPPPPPPSDPLAPVTQMTSVPQSSQAREPLIPTALPPAPITLEPEFIERSGWLIKLSHRRGVFGDKWHKRYFVLHGSWIYYFKKYGDSIPRGAIRLHPGAWVKPIAQGTARQSDAVAKTPPNAIISVVRCFGVHRPENFASSLSNLLSQEDVAEVFRSQTISVSNSDSCSRTFYMIAPSNDERVAWVDAIQNNIRAHALSESALETSCKELRNMLRAIQSFPPSSDLSPLLSLLHQRTSELHQRHHSRREH